MTRHVAGLKLVEPPEYRLIRYPQLMELCTGMPATQRDLLVDLVDPARVSVAWVIVPLTALEDPGQTSHLVEVLMPVQGVAETPMVGYLRMSPQAWEELEVMPREWLSED